MVNEWSHQSDEHKKAFRFSDVVPKENNTMMSVNKPRKLLSCGVSVLTVPLTDYCTISLLYNKQNFVMMF